MSKQLLMTHNTGLHRSELSEEFRYTRDYRKSSRRVPLKMSEVPSEGKIGGYQYYAN